MSNIPGPQIGLNEIIDAFTTNPFEGKSKTSPLRPSSAGKCEMELGHEYMEYRGLATYPPEQKKASVTRLLNLGNAIETHANYAAQDAFKQMGVPIKIKYKQQTVTLFRLEHDNSMIEGQIDLYLETDDWHCLPDWKSKGDKYSQFHKSSWDEFIEKLVNTGHAVKFGEDSVYLTDLAKFIDSEMDVFFNNNLYQLNSYAHSDFIQERIKNSPKAFFCSILQYNKNDSRIREIRFSPSQEVFERVKAKYNKVARVVDGTKSTEGLNKEYLLGSAKCGFCNFRDQCWPENDAMKDYFATLPKKSWPRDLDRLDRALQQQLTPLFEAYHAANLKVEELEKIEQDIVKLLDKNKVYKIRLNESQIYKLKRLKSGGVGGNGQLVLRRDKV